MTLQNGDIVLVDGVSGIYFNGQTTLSNLTVTDKDPDYVLRFDGQITSPPEINLPILEFGTTGLYVAILQTCLKWHGTKGLDIDGSLGVKTLAALREFRKQHYMDGDTVCDDATWKKLLEE